MRCRIFLLFAMAFFLSLAGSSQADKCDVTATGLNFGNYDVFSALPTDTTGTITVTCKPPSSSPNAPIPVIITMSTGNSGSFMPRQMQPAGSDRLDYNIFTNSSFSTILGDGSGGTATLANPVSRDFPWAVTIYGRIPPLQNVSVGSYGDVIILTILY